MSYLLNYNPGTPQYTYPRRGGAKLSGTAIIHTAECAMDLDGDDSSAEVCASFIANRADYGSYHRLVDSDSIIDMVPWEYEAWQDSETNNWAVGISAAVQAGKWHIVPASRRDRIYRNLASCAADFVRHMAGKGVTVPLRRISGADARNRVPGFCAHGDSGLHRSDPGAQFDWALFFNYIAQALGGITPQGTITPIQEEPLVPNESDKVFWPIEGSGKVSLNELLNSIDRKSTTANDKVDRIMDIIGSAVQFTAIDGSSVTLAEQLRSLDNKAELERAENAALRAAVAALTENSSVTPEGINAAIKLALSGFSITLTTAE